MMEAVHTLRVEETQNIPQESQLQHTEAEMEGYTVFQLSPSGVIQSLNIEGDDDKTSEVVGEHFSQFYSEEAQKNNLPQQLLNAAGEKGSVTYTGWRIRKDGSRIWRKTVVTALHDATGKVSTFTDVSWNLAEEQQQEIPPTLSDEKLQDRTAELEQLSDSLRKEITDLTQELHAFSYSISHDLQAPLRAITGYSAILQEDYKEHLDEEGQRVLGTITRNANRMHQLIQEVLRFSRLNRQKVSPQLVNMNALFQEVYTHVRETEDAARIVEFQKDDLPAAYGDRELISQVATNLISNALKYTRPREKTVISVQGHETEKECTYRIQDNGVGFDERYKDKLFSIFQRLHKETEFEGVGMGLAIAQQIVRKHGGKIWGEGTPNQGAVFYFSLPLAPIEL